jgi:hypothetical protein
MVKSRPPLAGLVWLAFYIPGVARRAAALHPGLLLHQRLRRCAALNNLCIKIRAYALGFAISRFQQHAHLAALHPESELPIMQCARRAPWSAAAKLPPSLFGLFKAAASRPHSKGFAATYEAEFIRSALSPTSNCTRARQMNRFSCKQSSIRVR